MSGIVLGPPTFDPVPQFSLQKRMAVGALVHALDHPNVQNLSTALCAIAAAVDVDDFGCALLSATNRILFP